LNKKPITDNLDKAYIKTMHQQLQSETFKDWSVQNVILSNRSNQQRLSLYQPAMKELAYRNHTDEKFYSNIQKFARSVKKAEAKDLQNLE
jgi:hypothetical protein